MKAIDVLPGMRVMCCRRPSWHEPQVVTVTRVLCPQGSPKLAFGYEDRSGAAREDTRGITSPYAPSDEVEVIG